MSIERSPSEIQNVDVTADTLNLDTSDLETLMTQVRNVLGDHTDSDTIEQLLETLNTSIDSLELNTDDVESLLATVRDSLVSNTGGDSLQDILLDLESILGDSSSSNTLESLLNTVTTQLNSIDSDTSSLNGIANDTDLLSDIANHTSFLNDTTPSVDVQVENTIHSTIPVPTEFTDSSTDSDLNTSTSVNSEHVIKKVVVDYTGSDNISIEIGIEETANSQRTILRETANNEATLVDEIVNSGTEEIYVQTNNLTSGTVRCRMLYYEL